MKKESMVLGFVVLAAILVHGGILYAAYLVTSPKLGVKVEQYDLTLNQNATTVRIGESIDFYGALTKDGNSVVGKTITLYYGNGTSTGLSDVTVVGGGYTIVWTATRQGNFEFYTQVDVDEP